MTDEMYGEEIRKSILIYQSHKSTHKMAVSGYKGLVQLLEKNSSDKIANKKEYFFKVTGDHATYFSILPPYTRKTFEALVKNNDFIINTNPDVQSTVSKAQ